jgi:hypothetical protein
MKILLILLLISISILLTPTKESFDNSDMNQVITYINNSIKFRQTSETMRSDEYQQQILPLKHALNYANYIMNLSV